MSTHRFRQRWVGLALLAAVLTGAVLLWVTRPTSDDPAEVNAAIAGDPDPAATTGTDKTRPTPAQQRPTATGRATKERSRTKERSTTPRTSSAPRTQVPRGAPASDRAPASTPSRLEIPELSATLPVTPDGVTEQGAMEIPEDPRTAGWYRFGPQPGRAGATVISAHVDSRVHGPGPLSTLRDLDPGAEVTVTTGEERHRYEVVKVYTARKDALDLDALFRRDGAEALHLVTCGGEFDPSTGHYQDNVVAVAKPVGTKGGA